MKEKCTKIESRLTFVDKNYSNRYHCNIFFVKPHEKDCMYNLYFKERKNKLKNSGCDHPLTRDLITHCVSSADQQNVGSC